MPITSLPSAYHSLFEHKIEVFVRFCLPEPSISGVLSTKSRFLCAFGVWKPCFRAFRAQNRGFCALLPARTLDFRRFEHKIEVFVRFEALEPPFSGVSSTKSGFLCAFRLRSPRFQASRAQNRGFCALLAAGTLVFWRFTPIGGTFSGHGAI